MKKILSILLSSFLILSLNGCKQTPEENRTAEITEEEIPTIITTIIPLYSFTRYITYNTPVIVNNIIPPRASAHNFQLTPNVLKQIEKADLIITNGLELEEFLEDALANSKATIVDTSKDVELIKSGNHAEHENEHENEKHLEEEEIHQHGEYDPHIWLDPLNAIKQSENIYNVLVTKYPDYKKTYETNYKWLKYNLEKLDQEIKTELSKTNIFPYITFHNAFAYFDKRYGTKASGVIQEFPGEEPSLEYMKELAQIIKKNNVKIIFKEPQTSPKTAEIIAKDYNLIIAELDPVGSDLSKESYFKMMRKNLKTLILAFSKVNKNNEKTS